MLWGLIMFYYLLWGGCRDVNIVFRNVRERNMYFFIIFCMLFMGMIVLIVRILFLSWLNLIFLFFRIIKDCKLEFIIMFKYLRCFIGWRIYNFIFKKYIIYRVVVVVCKLNLLLFFCLLGWFWLYFWWCENFFVKFVIDI